MSDFVSGRFMKQTNITDELRNRSQLDLVSKEKKNNNGNKDIAKKKYSMSKAMACTCVNSEQCLGERKSYLTVTFTHSAGRMFLPQ